MKTLRLEIEFPGFYADDCETPEDAENAMDLTDDNVIVVFQGGEGDSPGVVLRSLEGRIRVWRIAGVQAEEQTPDVVLDFDQGKVLTGDEAKGFTTEGIFGTVGSTPPVQADSKDAE